MVKRDRTNSVSENDHESTILNENGKRTTEEQMDGKKRLKTKSLYRQPTVKELNRLQETENLFNSNLFRLQIEEVLDEVKVKEKTLKRFQEWFSTFKEHLLSIPEDSTEYDLTEKTIFKELNVKSPTGNELNKTKCMFRFQKFKDIKIVGSYTLGNSINSELIVDTQITVPSDTYTKNDSINYRYHKKRAAYLAYVASHLKQLEIIEEIKYIYVNGCQTKPMLDVKPIGKLGTALTVRINIVCDSETYKLHRFSPSRNNLRETWLFETANNEINSDIGPPTPYYNSSVLNDLTDAINQEFLEETFTNHENLKQAVVLLKIWLRQRKLQVSGYVISMFVAYFVQIKRINNIMSSYQIIRNIWIAIKSSEWDTKGVSLYKGPTPGPTLEEFHQHFPVVFVDKSGFYNICWQMHKGTYNALKRECRLAIEMLDNPKINSFIPLFMTPVQPLMQFDHIIRFKNVPKLKESVLSKVPKASRVNYGVNDLALVVDTVYELLSKGLGNRVNLILQLVEADFSWPVNKNLDKAKKGWEEKLSFGLILNAENVISIVDRGPPANLPESEEFRAFWGSKSELRRFQDGSITEACVWSADSMAERRALPKQIVDYLMNFKYGVPPSETFHVCTQLDGALRGAQEAAGRVLRAFDALRTDLRALDQLPLDISAVYGVSPVFSYCEPRPALPGRPQPHARRRGASALLKDTAPRPPPYTPACRAVLELGHSGKWPGDLEAFRCLKAAFHVQIADRLTKQYSLPTQPYPTHVDVLKEGYVFRLQIAHPKEITLLRREIENGVVKHKETEESIDLQLQTVLMPRLRGALHGLQQRHAAFGPAACLLRRWLSAQLLPPPHLPPPLPELLAAAAFLRPAPLEPPAQPAAGFLRALRLLAEFDWARDVLLLDFNDDMTHPCGIFREDGKRRDGLNLVPWEKDKAVVWDATCVDALAASHIKGTSIRAGAASEAAESDEEMSELERKLCERDAALPRMRIATAHDGALAGAWSRAAPSREVLLRAQSLARSALAHFERAVLRDCVDSALGIFVPSLSGYDVLIHLAPQLVPYSSEQLHRTQPVRTDGPDRPDGPVLTDLVPVVEFNPVERYLKELRSAYDEFALFFHDQYGGRVIAVLWRPGLDEWRELQIGNGNALTPVEVDGEIKYRVNKEAILEDFRIMGRGLVEDITVP